MKLMSYYPEPDIYITDKVNLVLDLSHYATKKNWKIMQVLIRLI